VQAKALIYLSSIRSMFTSVFLRIMASMLGFNMNYHSCRIAFGIVFIAFNRVVTVGWATNINLFCILGV